jgi:two-component system cell cycle sensor histidine kinase/response regulator CckA
MPPFEAFPPTNQIAFDFMSEGNVAAHRGPAPAGAATGGGESAVSHLPVLGAIFALGIVPVAIAASSAGTPILLTLLAAFAVLGVFFLFGVFAGHVRVGDRLLTDDVVRSIADGVDRGLMVSQRDGSILYANAKLEELVGRLGAREVAALDMAFGAELAVREAFFRLNRAADRGDRHGEDFRMASGGGMPQRILRIEVAPLDLGRARETGPAVLWTVHDVTEERMRAAAARQGLVDTLSYYDVAPVGLLTVDAGGTVRHINGTLSRWLGYPNHPLTNRVLRLTDILSAETVALIDGARRDGAADQVSLDIDATRDDGRLLPVRLVSRTGRDGMRLIAFINRESDHGLGLDAPASEVRFARFVQSAPFGIASVSSDGRVTSSNGAFARLMLDANGGIGKHAVDLLCRGDDKAVRVAVEENLRRVLAGKAGGQPVETVLSVGNVRRVFMSPMVEQATDREAAMLYVVDASEQKALEAQYAQSSKMEAVGKLAGGIAHDFNNVLTAIIGYSDLLLQTHAISDPAYKDIKNIQQSAYRAAGMVRQLLSFSRRQTLQAEPLLLDEVINENASMLRTSVGEKISIKIQPSRDLWYVKVDKTEFTRVIVNLAVNARDAMPDGGVLSVKTRNITERESQKIGREGMPIGEYVAIEVSDTGTGMPNEVLEKIFEPFFTTKGVGKGTGLGLSTVYGIVKQSGGFVYVDSALGKGTTFQLYLPRFIPETDEDPVAAAPIKEKDVQAKAADLTGTGRVLLVEDEDVVRSFAVRALTRQGYEVLEASDGQEALDIVAEHEGAIDIVVTDVVMPEMDGPTMFRELRKTNPSIKVIFVSGYPNEAFRETLGSEDVAFLPKPFSLPQLAEKVKQELGR